MKIVVSTKYKSFTDKGVFMGSAGGGSSVAK